MTTVFDITLMMMRHVTDVLNGTATDGGTTYLKDTRLLTQANEYYAHGTLWLRSGAHANKALAVDGHVSQKVTFEGLATAICTQQVETATVLGSVTGAGNATVVITAAAMPNSPKTISVAVANLDTAAQVATKIRTALNADTDVKTFFDIGGSNADITLTTKIARANDATMNMSIDNGTCTGLTAAPTSTNTTAGVAGPSYALTHGAFPLEQMYGAIQTALDETWVMDHDESLTGDGTTHEFTIPAGVSDIREIWFERPSVPGYLTPSTHFEENQVTGKLVFEYGYAPVKDDIIHTYFRSQHAAITGYTVEISPEINIRWLILAAARELLFWGRAMYGEKKPTLMIDDRLNKVLAALKGMKPRLGSPDVRVKTAGGGRGN